MNDQIAAGSAIDFDGLRTVTSASEITGVTFTEGHGRQGLMPTFATARSSRRRWRCATSAWCRPSAILRPQHHRRRLPAEVGLELPAVPRDGSLGVHHPSS